MTRRMLSFPFWADEAEATACEFAAELARVEPGIPLTAYPEIVVSLAGLAERVSEVLRLTGGLAAAEAAGKTGRAGDGPPKLAAAAKQAATAGELLASARGRIRKDLRSAGTGPDPDDWPLRPTPSGAYWALASLASSLSKTHPGWDGVLDGLQQSAGHETQILKAARDAASPIAEGLRDAYKAMPDGAVQRQPPAADEIGQAEAALSRSLASARDALAALTEDLNRHMQGAPR